MPKIERLEDRAMLAVVFTVTNTENSGAGSLRWAIEQANANPGSDTIEFNIPTSDPGFVDADSHLPGGDAAPDVFVIRILSQLVLSDDGTTIDGRSQASFSGDTNPFGPEIVIDGSLAGANGLVLSSNGNRISGLNIQGANHDGIHVQGSSNWIEGNYIGTDATGTLAAPNNRAAAWRAGIFVRAGADGNLIGTNSDGTADEDERNVLSGNIGRGVVINGAAGNTIAGNYVGTDSTGTAAVGNGEGVVIENGSQNTTLHGNVISANAGDGVRIVGSGTGSTLVSGNYIGTDASGLRALGNIREGVSINNAANNLVGGANAAARNIISGNGGRGIFLAGAAASDNALVGNYIGTDALGASAVPNGTLPWEAGVVIGAGSHDNLVDRNLISGNRHGGLRIGEAGTDRNIVTGNFIGTDAAGLVALANGSDGVLVGAGAVGTRIGTDGDGVSDTAERNVISGNAANGILIQGADYTAVAGNYIGVDASGSVAIANTSNGVNIVGSSTRNRIGGSSAQHGNIVSGNASHGIRVVAHGNSIQHNIIGANGGDGVYLGGNGNHVQANLIGTDHAGASHGGNQRDGIRIEANAASDNLIGGSDPALGNVISGNANGILLNGGDRNILQNNIISANRGPGIQGLRGLDNVIRGNRIGSDLAGTFSGNGGPGIHLHTNAGHSVIGGADESDRNIIAGNLVGLWIAGVGGNAIAGNVISGNTSHGAIILSGNNVLVGNRIGTDPTGTAAWGNGSDGIQIFGSAGNVIGGADEGDGNLIAGNMNHGIGINGAHQTRIQGNYIGTDVNGTLAIANGNGGIRLQQSEDVVVVSNVVSGNGGNGLELEGAATTGTVIAGNFIGVNAVGQAAVPNAASGVRISGGATSSILEANVVSGNGAHGIHVAGTRAHVNSLSVVDQMIAAALPSTTATATIAQADLHDASGAPGTTRWNFNHPVPGGGGDDYAIVGIGTLQVNTAGTFTFALSGDDGGRLRINGNDVIVDDTLHAFQDRFGEVTLAAGTHAFEWVGFERGGGAAWELSVAVGSGRSGPIDRGNGWRVLGDSDPAPEIELHGMIDVTAYYSAVTGGQITIAGNYIGTDAAGMQALGNAHQGVRIENAANNLVGGTTVADRNVIAANGSIGIAILQAGAIGNVVQGNYVGLAADGNTALGNLGQGAILIEDAVGNTVGGGQPGARNVISANQTHGVAIRGAAATGNRVAGNYIGTDASGALARGNRFNGVAIHGGAHGNLIGVDGDGSDDESEGNVISGNGLHGVLIQDAGTNGNAVAGNYIGTDVRGTGPLGNGGHGVRINNGAQFNRIGTGGDGANDAAERNVISGNGNAGVQIWGASYNRIAGNYIGTDATGAVALGNQGAGGVWLLGGSQSNVIGTDGDGVNDAVERNVISGNGGFAGVFVEHAGTDQNVIAGNLIGTDLTGTMALGNRGHGIEIKWDANGNRVGTNADGMSDAVERNIISGNSGIGIYIWGDASATVVDGNYVGTDVTGALALGNGADGVYVAASNQRIGSHSGLGGEANLIAFNGGAGVRVVGSHTAGVSVRGNSIHSNGGLGIDLGGDGVTPNDSEDADLGPNLLQNYPVIQRVLQTSAGTQLVGRLDSTPNATFVLDFYANTGADPSGHGEGERWVGSWTVTADADGQVQFTADLQEVVSPGELITATASAADGSTSEFSESRLTFLSVSVDAKPGSERNPVNLSAGGVIPVALLTTATFDAASVVMSTVTFAGAAVERWSLEDVDGDGDLDLILHFRVQETLLVELYKERLREDLEDGTLDSKNHTIQASLTGLTAHDEWFAGFDELDLFMSSRDLDELLETL